MALFTITLGTCKEQCALGIKLIVHINIIKDYDNFYRSSALLHCLTGKMLLTYYKYVVLKLKYLFPYNVFSGKSKRVTC